MAEDKKPEAKKIIDVAHPGKTPPAGNSKSVILGHGPMMKDPMVVDGDADKIEPPAEDLSKRTSKAVIEPLADQDKEDSKTKKSKPKPDSKSKPKTKHKLKQDDDTKTIAALAAEVDAEDSDDDESPDESDDDQPGVKTLPPAELPEIDVDEDESKPEQITDEDKESENDQAEKTELDVEKPESDEKQKNAETNPNEAELKDDEEEKHQKEIQKLADSKKFYLPINTVEKRRSKRVVIFGVLLSIVLIVAWIDIALDAGLIELGGIEPVTSFFSN